MAAPLAKTFQTLTTTANPFAGEVLVAALDVPLPSIQREAVKSLVSRGAVREQMEAIRRYREFPAAVRRELEESAQSLVPALRHSLLVGRGELERAALELTRAGEAYGVIEDLLGVLRGANAELQTEAVETLRHLVNRLYGHLHGHQTSESASLRNASQIQHLTLTALVEACQYFHELAYPEGVVESILALGGPGHAASQNVLSQGSVECRSLARELLQTSRHPGVMRFLLDSFSRTFLPPKVVDSVQTRTDPEFILATLRWMPKRLSATQERNLRQIEHIAWLTGREEALELIPEELQTALLRFIAATGLDRDLKTAVREWIVRHGCPEARNEAIAVLDELDNETVQEIVLDGLDSDDPSVQAWATGQLRPQHVPDALNKLIARLDSPEASVQAVARQELQGFDLECLLSRFEEMSPEARANAGALLKKINPNYLSDLTHELEHPIRRHRLRAVRGALAFGWHLQMFPSLFPLINDEDTVIRRAAIEVLGHIPAPESIAALVALKNDPSVRVRESVKRALANIRTQELLDVPLESLRSS